MNEHEYWPSGFHRGAYTNHNDISEAIAYKYWLAYIKSALRERAEANACPYCHSTGDRVNLRGGHECPTSGAPR